MPCDLWNVFASALMDGNTWFSHLLRFCSTSKEISTHWPGPPRSQWPTAESLFSCPKFLGCRRLQEDLRGGPEWGWWRNWCTGRHSGPSPVSVLPPFSPHCTVSAGPLTTACVLAEPGCSSCLVTRGADGRSLGRLDEDADPTEKTRTRERSPPKVQLVLPAHMGWRGGKRDKRVWRAPCVKFGNTYAQQAQKDLRLPGRKRRHYPSCSKQTNSLRATLSIQVTHCISGCSSSRSRRQVKAAHSCVRHCAHRAHRRQTLRSIKRAP